MVFRLYIKYHTKAGSVHSLTKYGTSLKYTKVNTEKKDEFIHKIKLTNRETKYVHTLNSLVDELRVEESLSRGFELSPTVVEIRNYWGGVKDSRRIPLK